MARFLTLPFMLVAARVVCIGLAVLFSLSGSARAQPDWPLAAVGRLGNDVRFGCSGVLIERDLVLTAAHCVNSFVDDPDGRFFTTGAYPGLPAESIPIRAGAVHPLYTLSLPDEVTRVRFDLALLRLERPVEDPRIVPLRMGEPPEVGDALVLASYRWGVGRRARERKCEVFAEFSQAFAIGCEVRSGESGSPIIRVSEEGLSVAAVLTSRVDIEQQPVGLGAAISDRLGPVREALPTP